MDPLEDAQFSEYYFSELHSPDTLFPPEMLLPSKVAFPPEMSLPSEMHLPPDMLLSPQMFLPPEMLVPPQIRIENMEYLPIQENSAFVRVSYVHIPLRK